VGGRQDGANHSFGLDGIGAGLDLDVNAVDLVLEPAHVIVEPAHDAVEGGDHQIVAIHGLGAFFGIGAALRRHHPDYLQPNIIHFDVLADSVVDSEQVDFSGFAQDVDRLRPQVLLGGDVHA